jgi:cytochrome c biogenesis protein CcmG/thiol:disulfide interchange protein DsbE
MQKTAAAPDSDPEARPPRRLGWALAPLLVFGAMALMFLYALSAGDPSKLPSALIGKPVPAVSLPAVEGLAGPTGPVPGFSAADLARGEPVVVNFWASWCPPCVAEHPLLIDLVKRTGVTLYGVNHKDQADAARRFLNRYGNPFKAVGADGSGRAGIDWGVYGMPETFVVDGKGRIAYKHVGPLTAESLEKKLIPAIAAARSAKP